MRPGASSRRCRASRSIWRRRRRRSASTCCATRWRCAGDATDEATLAERAGHRGAARRGRSAQPEDHDAGRSGAGRAPARRVSGVAVACASATATTCIGWCAGRPLMLGGVTIPFEQGPARPFRRRRRVPRGDRRDPRRGGAGRHRPALPRYRSAPGRTPTASSCCAARVALVRAAGYRGRQRRRRRHRAAAEAGAVRRRDARATWRRRSACDASQVSVKGKTNEGVDSMGAGESIAAHAVALLIRA